MLTMCPMEHFVSKRKFYCVVPLSRAAIYFSPLNKQRIQYILYSHLNNHKMYLIKWILFSSLYFSVNFGLPIKTTTRIIKDSIAYVCFTCYTLFSCLTKCQSPCFQTVLDFKQN